MDDDYEAGQRLDPNESSIVATGASCLKAGLDRSPDAGALKRQRCRRGSKPQLTKLVGQPPDEPEWLHELKFDGYRMHARLDRGAVRLLMRTGLDWTHKYPAIAAAVAWLPAICGHSSARRPRSTGSC